LCGLSFFRGTNERDPPIVPSGFEEGILALAKELPKEEFRREVDRYLTGKETEAWEIIYFKLYKGKLSVVERALEIAALILGCDKSRGYSLEMICADFLAGAALETDNSIKSHESSASVGCSAATCGPSVPAEKSR
jgi:hypothetical protein